MLSVPVGANVFTLNVNAPNVQGVADLSITKSGPASALKMRM